MHKILLILVFIKFSASAFALECPLIIKSRAVTGIDIEKLKKDDGTFKKCDEVIIPNYVLHITKKAFYGQGITSLKFKEGSD